MTDKISATESVVAIHMVQLRYIFETKFRRENPTSQHSYLASENLSFCALRSKRENYLFIKRTTIIISFFCGACTSSRGPTTSEISKSNRDFPRRLRTSVIYYYYYEFSVFSLIRDSFSRDFSRSVDTFRYSPKSERFQYCR